MAKSSKRIKSASITRFAHPFFTLVKPADRKAVNGAKRLTDHIETQLEKIPSVKGDSVMRLDDTIFARTRGKVSTSQNLGDALTMGPIAAVIAGAMFFCQLSPEDITIGGRRNPDQSARYWPAVPIPVCRGRYLLPRPSHRWQW